MDAWGNEVWGGAAQAPAPARATPAPVQSAPVIVPAPPPSPSPSPSPAPVPPPAYRKRGRASASEDRESLALSHALDIAEAWERRRARLAEVLADLRARGWHDLSPFWREALTEVYAVRPRIVPVRVGRRGGKSSTSCRVAISECTAQAHYVPPGDIGVFHILSADRDQAKERVKTCADICEALGIEHEPTAAEIRFPQYRTAIRVTTASVRAAVSSTSIGALFDEMAHWEDDRGANPAADILRAFKPSILTMPGAILWLVSAPWTTRDAHAQEYERTAHDRLRLHAPTWVANPTTTEDECRDAAEDEIDFLRNYAAVPCDIDNAVFFPANMVDEAVARASA